MNSTLGVNTRATALRGNSKFLELSEAKVPARIAVHRVLKGNEIIPQAQESSKSFVFG